MLGAIILLLIQLCLVVLVVYVILWVLQQIGLALPPKVVQILWVICVLIVLYIIVAQMVPMLTGGGGRLLRIG